MLKIRVNYATPTSIDTGNQRVGIENGEGAVEVCQKGIHADGQRFVLVTQVGDMVHRAAAGAGELLPFVLLTAGQQQDEGEEENKGGTHGTLNLTLTLNFDFSRWLLAAGL